MSNPDNHICMPLPIGWSCANRGHVHETQEQAQACIDIDRANRNLQGTPYYVPGRILREEFERNG